ncbi:MAG: hypothetical protein KJ737_13490 [Proteobacteria bacterium]|nr:hypothetical protein [Pseudomonadota bacterium]
MSKKNLFVIILIFLFGCSHQDSHEWNPIFEETSFDYLTTNIERSLSSMEEAYSEANITNPESIKENLDQAKKRLLEIKDYYVPLTVIRQKIYDAERFYKLNNVKKSEKLLNDSKAILHSLDLTTKSENFDKLIVDLNAMINGVILSFNKNSELYTYNKMKTLGEHVNLMLFKGDIVLSGIEFEK